MTVFSSGISALRHGKLLNLLLGWSFDVSIVVAAVSCLAYIFLVASPARSTRSAAVLLDVLGFGRWCSWPARVALARSERQARDCRGHDGYAPGAYTRSSGLHGHAPEFRWASNGSAW